MKLNLSRSLALLLTVQSVSATASEGLDFTKELDCTEESNKDTPYCFCRNPNNWYDPICQGGVGLSSSGNYGSRIVGGEDTALDEYPWFARLIYRSGSWAGCGGMLVAPDYVLTAAHCVFPNANWYANAAAVQIGAVCSASGDNCNQPIQQINVERIIAHPDYNSDTLNNDFALVKLASRANASPVEMDQGSIVDNYQSNKRNLWAIGFGTLSSGGATTSRLKHVELAFVPRDDCDSSYGGSITQYMMCASDPGQDSCQGDSGGPLYDKSNNVLVGVVSWGYGCAAPQYPGVYAQVSSRWNWIESTICANHSQPKPGFCVTEPPSPTPAPTDRCQTGQLDLQITVGTDNYPAETSWILSGTDGFELTSETFPDQFTEYITQECLDESLCYTFTIKDSYGDGMFAGGFFSVRVDNTVVFERAEGIFSELSSPAFGGCQTTSPSVAVPTASPTAAPIGPPTIPSTSNAPSVLASAVPSPNDPTCALDELQVEITVLTDAFPNENSWTLTSSNGEIRESVDFFNAFTRYEDSFCVASSACHVFTITDSYGDGIFIEGDFSLKVDGELKLQNPSEQWGSLVEEFGACSTSRPTATSSDTPSPSMSMIESDSPSASPSDSSIETPTSSSSDSPSVSPTILPQTSCGADESNVEISVTTDNWAYETSWTLVSSNGDTVSSEPFVDNQTTYISNLCVKSDICHQFSIFDSYGDGFLTGGDFTLTVNGELLLSDPTTDWSLLEVEFGSCVAATLDPTPSPTPGTETPTSSSFDSPSASPSDSSIETPTSSSSDSPSVSPTDSSIAFPSVSPTILPQTSCGADESNVEISVTTDNWAYETSWTLVSSNGDTVSSEPFVDNQTTYISNLCVKSDICHQFSIFDSYGDGFLTGGDFTLTVNGELLLSDPTTDWSLLEVEFGSCVTVTLDPTPSPTSDPTPSPTPSPTSDSSEPYNTECGAGELDVTVSVTTDNYPEEQSWTITDPSGEVAKGGDFEKEFTTYDSDLCLDASKCYTFTALDSYGDGMFSDGTFSLTVDDEVKLTEPDGTWATVSVDFGLCGNCELEVDISVTTDAFPFETSWELTDSAGALVGGVSSYSSPYVTDEKSFCLDPDECYLFVINDSYGDGLFLGGDFTVNVNGVEELSNPWGDSWSSLSLEIGNCN